MQTTQNEVSDEEARRSITVSRTIEGRCARVFEAWTDLRHLAHWWGPHGFTTTTQSFDFRPGGVWAFVMHGPEGIDYANWIEWLEIEAPTRLVYRHGERAGDPDAFVSTVTFVEHGWTTKITMHARFRTETQRDEVVERYGALDGARQTLERLCTYLDACAPNTRPRAVAPTHLVTHTETDRT